jgi:hypothetical protein
MLDKEPLDVTTIATEHAVRIRPKTELGGVNVIEQSNCQQLGTVTNEACATVNKGLLVKSGLRSPPASPTPGPSCRR